jgi:hypothetical protein
MADMRITFILPLPADQAAKLQEAMMRLISVDGSLKVDAKEESVWVSWTVPYNYNSGERRDSWDERFHQVDDVLGAAYDDVISGLRSAGINKPHDPLRIALNLIPN